MKKSKILVPALAVLALGVAGSAAGTVAWFQSTGHASIETEIDKGNITAKVDDLDLGKFKITAVVTSSVQPVSLTDNSGNCFVYVGGTDESNLVPVQATQKSVEISYKVDIEYVPAEEDGIIPTEASEVKNIWLNVIEVGGALENGLDMKISASSPVKVLNAEDSYAAVTGNEKAELFDKDDMDDVVFARADSSSPWKVTDATRFGGSFFVGLDGASVTQKTTTSGTTEVAIQYEVTLTPAAHTA